MKRSLRILRMATTNASNILFEEETEEEEDEEAEEDQENDEDYVPPVRTSTPAQSPPRNSSQPIVIEEEEEEEEEGEGENALPPTNSVVESESIVGSFSCPICMEPWSSEGIHRTCCLPCGHVYGRSCIERWIQECGKTIGRCPQCNRKCKLNEIRNIYASHVAVANEDLQKEVSSLRSENEFLKMQNTALVEEVRLHKKREMDHEIHEKQKAARIERLSSGVIQTMPSEYADERVSEVQILSEHITALQNSGWRGYGRENIALKAEFRVDGARVFDMDVSNQILILCRRPSTMPRMHVLTKISLLSLDENENIPLPSSNKTVKDIRISLPSRRLALLASMEKTLSIFSMESNNIVLTYNLPAPAWSCSWDFNNPHHVYAGLQNGMLTVFDLRQTREPIEYINGLTRHPVHTIHSIAHNRVHSPSSSGTVLTASSNGPCQWNIGGVGERPFLIPGIENQGMCISLAYCDVSDDIVATFRPEVNIYNDIVASQPSICPTAIGSGSVTWGSHVLLKRVDDISYQNRGFIQSNVSAVRMQKSAILSKEDCSPLFAYGHDRTNGLCVRNLPSLGVVDHLKEHLHPILDVKYAHSTDTGVLGCVSENRLQLYTCFEH